MGYPSGTKKKGVNAQWARFGAYRILDSVFRSQTGLDSCWGAILTLIKALEQELRMARAELADAKLYKRPLVSLYADEVRLLERQLTEALESVGVEESA